MTMPDVFISYSREDAQTAQELRDALQDAGLDVFVDQALVAGVDFSSAITEALNASRIVVVLLSRHSVRSQFVEAELRAALERRLTVIPVLLDKDATNNWIWPLVSDRQATRVRSEEDFRELVATVAKIASPTPTPTMQHSTALQPASSRSLSFIWIMVLVGLGSAIAGAVITWLLM